MEIDCEKMLTLIEERPPLYNFTLKDHHNREITDKLWEEIAIEMHSSVSECKSKWINLRSSYSRYIRQLKKNPTDSLKRKKWHLADNMDFLHEFVRPHVKTSIKQECEMEENFQDEDSNQIITNDHSGTPSPKTNCDILPGDLLIGPTIKILNSQTDDMEFDNNHMYFFKSLLPDIQKLNSRRRRKFKENVLKCLNDLLDEQESEVFIISQPSFLSSPTPKSIL